jgi:NADH-quinone oxidoreductase subunit J
LNAQFLAIVNIIVYAGAIMVLFLFVVMLMNLNAESEPKKHRMLQFAGLISGGCLFLVLIAAISETAQASNVVQMGSGDNGLIKNLGMVLFKDYVLPFEISSVLFLSAMIGAVVIGKKERS